MDDGLRGYEKSGGSGKRERERGRELNIHGANDVLFLEGRPFSEIKLRNSSQIEILKPEEIERMREVCRVSVGSFFFFFFVFPIQPLMCEPAFFMELTSYTFGVCFHSLDRKRGFGGRWEGRQSWRHN
jgi:hypothetical protein